MSFSFQIENLNLTLNTRPILRDIQFNWQDAHQVLGVIGANGAGKSSIFRCIMGIEQRYSGNISLEQTNLNKLDTHQRTNLGIAYLAQESWLFEDMNARDNLIAIGQLLKIPNKELQQNTDHLLEQFNLTHVKGTKGKFLSGGEKRRLEICRVLLKKPKFIIFDEPFAGLDPKTNNEVTELMLQLKRDGHRMLLSDHQVDRVFSVADSVLLLHEGQLVTQGSAEEIKRNPVAVEAYL